MIDLVITSLKPYFPPEKKKRHYDKLEGITQEELLDVLVKNEKIKLREGGHPKDMGPNHAHHLFCKYHNFTGHKTNTCHHLKDIIQDLFDNGELERPNVITNPLPRNP